MLPRCFRYNLKVLIFLFTFVHFCTLLTIQFIKSKCVVSLLGTYGFPADVVAASTYDALLGFDIYLKSLPADQRILRSIAFVNIDDIVTKSLIMTFTNFFGEHSME